MFEAWQSETVPERGTVGLKAEACTVAVVDGGVANLKVLAAQQSFQQIFTFLFEVGGLGRAFQ